MTAIAFSEEGYRTLEEAGAQEWCEAHLDDFIAYLVQQVPDAEMTVGRILEEARPYIAAKQEEPEFLPIAQRCDGTGGLFLGFVIVVMEKYLQALVLDRFQ